jgi:hypothetical protein
LILSENRRRFDGDVAAVKATRFFPVTASDQFKRGGEFSGPVRVTQPVRLLKGDRSVGDYESGYLLELSDSLLMDVLLDGGEALLEPSSGGSRICPNCNRKVDVSQTYLG